MRILKVCVAIVFLLLALLAGILSLLGFYNGQLAGGVVLGLQTTGLVIAAWHLIFCKCKPQPIKFVSE